MGCSASAANQRAAKKDLKNAMLDVDCCLAHSSRLSLSIQKARLAGVKSDMIDSAEQVLRRNRNRERHELPTLISQRNSDSNSLTKSSKMSSPLESRQKVPEVTLVWGYHF
mmetsp:Transcript_93491/g.165364  ORF Transcript_93491/g.165364 Transcript_93491/m.165364 type:complete len:111 (+) Transcript_93491:84-416(+)